MPPSPRTLIVGDTPAHLFALVNEAIRRAPPGEPITLQGISRPPRPEAPRTYAVVWGEHLYPDWACAQQCAVQSTHESRQAARAEIRRRGSAAGHLTHLHIRPLEVPPS